VWSLTAVVNAPSIAVMERIGMSRVAVVNHPRVPPGPLREHVVYHLDAPPAGGGAAIR
jgi:RimJ/RimL family protein N-acetyltransferase